MYVSHLCSYVSYTSYEVYMRLAMQERSSMLRWCLGVYGVFVDLCQACGSLLLFHTTTDGLEYLLADTTTDKCVLYVLGMRRDFVATLFFVCNTIQRILHPLDVAHVIAFGEQATKVLDG